MKIGLCHREGIGGLDCNDEVITFLKRAGFIFVASSFSMAITRF